MLIAISSIRFAAPPIGSLRFQAPQVPAENRSQIIQANAYAPQCPQSSVAPGGKGTLSTEDCLFLNVYAPQNATNLPVLVWIHGGGYGLGNGQQDMQAIINTNNDSFIGVAIQYRLGAFGFLSSDEVDRFGSVNAGILDQTFALKWVQEYISSFGGDPRSVTISGESAGGGSVMLQAMAYGGTLGTSLFKNAIAASPYLPMQYGYKDWVPSQSYYAFAGLANCMPNTAYGSSSRTIFECLVNQDTEVLQNASFAVSASGTFGTWGFLPVTDNVFIQDVPSQQLLEKKVNGENLLVGNNANEGPLFVPQTINTESDLVAWLELTFPLFSNDDISRILRYCKSPCPAASRSIYPNKHHRPQFQRHRLCICRRLCNQRHHWPYRHQRVHSSHRPTTTRQQHLRRNHLRMPFLLDG
jgi:carboxylesterase type B